MVQLDFVILDRENNAPIEGATIVHETFSIVTDAEGKAGAEGGTGANISVRITAQGFRTISSSIARNRDRTTTLTLVPIAPPDEPEEPEPDELATRVTIRVLDNKTGRLVEGASVEVQGLGTRRTNSQGRTEFNFTTGGKVITIKSIGFEDFETSFNYNAVAGTETLTFRILPITGTGTLNVVVLDRIGTPIGNARVQLEQKVQQTDSNGETMFTTLVAGSFTLEATANGFNPASKSIRIDEQEELTTTFRLTKTEEPEEPKPTTGRVSGTVKDTEGEFVADAKVQIAQQETRTTSTGGFNFSQVIGGSFFVITSKEGFATNEIPIDVTPGGQVFVPVILEKEEIEEPEEGFSLEGLIDFVVTGVTDVTGEILTTYENALAFLTENFGESLCDAFPEQLRLQEEAAGRCKRFILIGGAASVKSIKPLVKGLTSEGAETLAKTLSSEGFIGITRLIEKNPRETISSIRKLSEKSFNNLFNIADETAAGNLFRKTFYDFNGRTIAQQGGRLTQWLQTNPDIKIILGIAGFLGGIGLWSAWAVIDNLGFYQTGAVRDLIRAGKLDEAQEAVNKARDSFNGIIGSVADNPLTQILTVGTFPEVKNSAQDFIEQLQLLIDAAREQEIETTTLTVSTDADPAQAEIVGIGASFQTPFTEALPPGSYDVTVNKEGFAPQKKTAIVKEDEENIITFALAPIEDVPEEGKSRLSIRVFNEKTSDPIRGTLAIDGKIELFHLHAYLVDVEPGKRNIEITEPKFETITAEIEVLPNETASQDFFLTPIPPEEPDFRRPTDEDEEPPEKGVLRVRSKPINARIFIDDEFTFEFTDTTVLVEPGTHKLTLKMSGFADDELQFEIKAGEEIQIERELKLVTEEELIDAWEVTFESIPDGADIFINGFPSGRFTNATIILLPGTYEIRFVKPNFEDFVETIVLEE